MEALVVFTLMVLFKMRRQLEPHFYRYSSIQLRSHNFTIIYAEDALNLALGQVENSDDDKGDVMFFDFKSAFQAIRSRTG